MKRHNGRFLLDLVLVVLAAGRPLFLWRAGAARPNSGYRAHFTIYG